jgi:hypothetical protein
MLITCKNFSCNFLKIGNIFATSNHNKMTLPNRTPEQLHTQAGQLLMRCYETANGVNCHGYVPQRSNSPDYLRAKRKALKIAKQYQDTPLYLHIKNFL